MVIFVPKYDSVILELRNVKMMTIYHALELNSMEFDGVLLTSSLLIVARLTSRHEFFTLRPF